jgi:hypothetical protein
MIRTFAVILLLLGLATATPVVCLCAPSEAAGLAAGLRSHADASGTATSERSAASAAADAPNLVATSVAAVVASLVATAGGVPSARPWQLPQPAIVRWLPPADVLPLGPAWSPALPPPR